MRAKSAKLCCLIGYAVLLLSASLCDLQSVIVTFNEIWIG